MTKRIQGLSRRSFITGASAAVAGAAIASIAGCTPSENPAPNGNASVVDTTDWRTPPAAIDEGQITETIDTEVVVIGAGIAGSNAALSAALNNKKVVVLQKEAGCLSNGMGFGAYGTKLQKEMDPNTWDPEEAINRWARESENRSDRKVVHRWVEYSGAAIDRMVDLCAGDPDSQPILYDPAFNVTYPDPWNFAYSGGVVFLGPGGTTRICELMLEEAKANGAEVYFSTPAVQLVREGEGPVSAVIAKKEDGSYLRVNASTGVILAAGDYGNDPVLRKEFMPHIEGLKCAYATNTNLGDGHRMGTWIGAQMQKGPHAGNIHYDPALPPAPSVAGSGCPWLWVNLKGERFCNEDMSYGQIYAQAMNQPEFLHYQVFDANFAADVEAGRMGEGNNKNGPFPGFGMAFIQPQIEEGLVLQGQTIAELAELMDVPTEALEKTVARYNELYDQGADLDFGKQAARLTAIKQAPFYAVLRQPSLLCALGGLVINENMEVLDDNGEVIKQLWAAGNNSGNWFGGLEHPMVIPGMSLGRAAVTGYLAGLAAAGVTF